MITIKGKYTEACIFANEIEDQTMRQIYSMCNSPVFENSKIRIMPDVSPGTSCVVGFTGTLTDKVAPSIIGNDIGCGMLIVKIPEIDPKQFDKIIRKYIPYGIDTHNKPYINFEFPLNGYTNISKLENSIGTLGGGNHFIEVDKSDNDYYLIIHSGSRNLGTKVYDYHMTIAKKLSTSSIPYLESNAAKNYLLDVFIAQEYAKLNRLIMAKIILENYFVDAQVIIRGINDIIQNFKELIMVDNDCTISEYVKALTDCTTNTYTQSLKIKGKGKYKINERIYQIPHNYMKNDIIHKGSISADINEFAVIPLNMRDGVILGYGKGNEDYNKSAPHGAGRKYSRNESKNFNIEEYIESMKGIYSSCISINTIDESPKAYKQKEEIIGYIKETINIESIITPIYNFKSDKDTSSWKSMKG